jgi:hypothetical protein
MLEEIRTLLDQLREPPAWPVLSTAMDPQMAADLRAESEKHWRLAIISLDELEAKLIGIYGKGADNPAYLELFDEVMEIVRRKSEPPAKRVHAIGQLMQKRWREVSGN